MALFKFRWPGQKEESDSAPVRRSRMAQTENVEDMRRRARHRLIGAAILVVLGIIVFPILFDTQPRPIPVDVPIEIPDREGVAPLVISGAKTQTETDALPSALPPTVSEVDNDEMEEEVIESTLARVTVPQPPAPPRLMPVSPPAAKPEPTPAPVVPSKPAVSEAERARALLEGRAPVSVPAQAEVRPQTQEAAQGRFIIQVGAFAEAAKVKEVRNKLERAGLQTYIQTVNTQEGPRTRVRVGPFSQRDQADNAATRIKELGLPAAVLTL